MTLALLPDAHARLRELLHARMRTPFVWGSNDCALFGADSVLVQTGVDLAARLRGTYATARQALRIVRAHGGLAAIVGEHLQRLAEPDPVLMDGDIVLARNGHRELLSVAFGRVLVAPGARGLEALHPAAARQVWRIA